MMCVCAFREGRGVVVCIIMKRYDRDKSAWW